MGTTVDKVTYLKRSGDRAKTVKGPTAGRFRETDAGDPLIELHNTDVPGWLDTDDELVASNAGDVLVSGRVRDIERKSSGMAATKKQLTVW